MPRILVVDNEQEICQLLKEFLARSGYSVGTACSGEEALPLMGQETPDVVLLDIWMPEMDGITLLQKIREEDEEIPVIMVTAIDETETAVSAMKMGAYDYVTKPVNLPQLELSIKRALEKGRLIKEVREYREGLERKVKERTADLEDALRALEDAHNSIKEAHLDSIYRLSLAAEFRDNHTASHLRRISEFSAVIASALGCGKDEVETIRVASILHDVGKIGIPDSILLKPGRLNGEEFDEIKKHSAIGGEILTGSSTDFLQMAEAIALTHHEKYDGTGYPKGLKGERIPLSGRIVAVADVFDALTTQRTYKPPFPNREAYRIIRAGAGKHFDPQVVKAFFSGIRAIEEAQESYCLDSWLKVFYGVLSGKAARAMQST